MSIAALRLEKVPASDAGLVRYRVMSPDFSTDHEWEEIGSLSLDVNAQVFDFECTGAWAGKPVVPPWVYGLPKPQMQAELTGKFQGFGFGAWSGRIRLLARKLLREGQFPQTL